MKYTIGNKVETVTASTGTVYKSFDVKDEQGNITKYVKAFSFYAQYNDIGSGAVVEGELENRPYKGKPSYSLVNAKGVAKPKAQPTPMSDISSNVAKAQDRKDESIMISSTARDATAILIALLAKEGTPDWRAKWLDIRYWLVKNWENTHQLKIAGTDLDYPQEDVDFDTRDLPF